MPKAKSAAEKLAELQERVKAAKDQLKAEEKRRHEILGATVAGLLQNDPDFKAAFLPKLRAAVTNPRDKIAIEQLLV
jgi:hypothetical protein